MLNKLFSYKLVAVMLTVFLLAVPLLGCAGDAGRKGGEEKGAPPEASAGYEEAEARLLELLAPLPQAGGDYKIAALLITLANPFWITMKEGYEAAAREYGVHVDVLSAPKEDDVNSQLEALQTVLAKDYDAVALSAITPYNLVPGVAEATRKGIPVIAVGTSVDAEAAEAAGARIEAFITSDFAKQGEIGAQYIIDKIGSGKVAVIEGLPGAAQGEARKNGARQAFENDNNIELVSVQPIGKSGEAIRQRQLAMLGVSPNKIGESQTESAGKPREVRVAEPQEGTDGWHDSWSFFQYVSVRSEQPKLGFHFLPQGDGNYGYLSFEKGAALNRM
ncbi:MAG: hypothetical protein C4582_14095 [Desulfobacteraceae bacterium]|nr:MAG: hypothetical protein C4582_14095 [Desulfobacteraceae bacterium]